MRYYYEVDARYAANLTVNDNGITIINDRSFNFEEIDRKEIRFYYRLIHLHEDDYYFEISDKLIDGRGNIHIKKCDIKVYRMH